jgi:hypothetical protein
MVSTHIIKKYDIQRYAKFILINLIFSGKMMFSDQIGISANPSISQNNL